MKESLKRLLANLDRADRQLKEIYLPSQNDYVSRISNLKKSLAQSRNWSKHRFKYMIGIKRANTLNPYKDIRKAFLNNLK